VYAPGLPEAVDELLLRCLAKAPGDRFQSMTEVQHALGELYVELDHAEVAVATVTPAVPLGRGFRSVFDGNLASHASGFRNSASTQARMPWLKFAPTPSALQPDDSDIQPPRRSRLRAALTGVLVAGVLAGFGTTAFVIYGTSDSSADPIPGRAAATGEAAPTVPAGSERRREDSEARRLQVARPVKLERPNPPEPASAAEVTAAPAVAGAATTMAPPATASTDATAATRDAAPSVAAPPIHEAVASAPPAADEHDASTDEQAAPPATTADPAPVATPAAPIERTSPVRRSSPGAGERSRRPREATRDSDKPVTAPRARTPAPVPPIPPAAPPATAAPAGSAPVTSPDAAPTEDLYDTR
jgi:hypothetical protein